ncbi:cleavage stimulating factor 64 [Primulina huaijiensis]|uniref:cleavage stimulating factor 64 n=1 Tax=Primulina huaijiensis TaxID=1492673 RepID=UPI003CC76638
MAGKQVAGDGVPPSLAGMSKSQLYDIMSQMKALIEQNHHQARQILIQNPALTRALFQAQIMLGMVQPPQTAPTVSPSASQNSQQPIKPTQQSNNQVSSFPVDQNQARKQQSIQNVASKPQSQSIPPNVQPQLPPSQSLPSIQKPKGQLGPRSTPLSVPQSSQGPNPTQLPQHTAPPPPSLHQSSMPMSSIPIQSQQPQPLQNTGSQYLPLQLPQQPPLPPQPRPQIQPFSHQVHAQMGPNLGFQHPGGHTGQHMHHSQPMFHPGTVPPAGLGPSFLQGQPPLPNQPLPPSLYQAGGPHLGMEFNQVGSSSQVDRGPNWRPGIPEAKGPHFPGPPLVASPMGPMSQPPRPPSLTPEMEKALLQQVMSLTPEQISMLPADQRNQVLQLQQMLRQ